MNKIVACGSDTFDVSQKLLEGRILFISGYVSDSLASNIVANILHKNIESPEEKITIFINAEGGDLRSVFSIYDMMKLSSCPIETICNGTCFVEAVLILTAGTKGMRYATKHSTITIGPLSYNSMYYETKPLSDIKEEHKLIEESNAQFFKALEKSCGKSMDNFKSMKKFLKAEEAIEYGVIDVLK